MNDVRIIKKESGELAESKINRLVGNKPYLEEDEKCFLQSTDLKNVNLNEINQISKIVKLMMKTIVESNKGNIYIEELFLKLKTMQTNDDLNNLVILFKKLYLKEEEAQAKEKESQKPKKSSLSNDSSFKSIDCKKTFNFALKNNNNLLNSIIVKMIIIEYYSKKLSLMKKEKINILENMKINNVSIDMIMDFIGEKFEESTYKNGIYEFCSHVLLDNISDEFEKRSIHLCWENCANACCSKCDKINDIAKHNIGEYDFITDGYQIVKGFGEIFDSNGQIIGDDGIVEKFVVTGCKNFEEQSEKELTIEEIKKINAAKEYFELYYFNVDSLEEADQIIARMNKEKTKTL